jgi:hypothetical protein
MTCPEAIMQALAEGASSPKDLAAQLSFGYSVIVRYLHTLQSLGHVVRVRKGLWCLVNQEYVSPPPGRPRKMDSAIACAEVFGITRQRAYILITKGLAWQEDGRWVRKHTKPGRPKV